MTDKRHLIRALKKAYLSEGQRVMVWILFSVNGLDNALEGIKAFERLNGQIKQLSFWEAT